MGRIFGTRFGRDRTLGGKDYPSISTAIRATKNKMKKIHLAAVEGHLTMKKHTTTNQSTVSVMGGGCVTRFDLIGTCGGDDLTSFEAANEATENEENKSDCGLRRQPNDNFTQQSTKNIQEQGRVDHKGRAT
jgi:hypothetical protein